jgi:environmental stress-induced protein Ves
LQIEIIHASEFETKAWKNGGGVTHEIYASPGAKGFAWRLSVAEVSQEGPFSSFAGMLRVLTVIEGRGMSLVGDDTTLRAEMLCPVAFSGTEQIDSVLDDGPVRDFNLIFDPDIVDGSVKLLNSGEVHLKAGDEDSHALYVVRGSAYISAHEVTVGDCAIWQGQDCTVKVANPSVALLVSLAAA